MIAKIRLPFGTLHVCNTCGYALDTFSQEAVRRFTTEHRRVPEGTLSVRAGDRVRISVPRRNQKEIVRETWKVEGLFYAGGHTSVFFLQMKEPKFHELCVSLRPLRPRRGTRFSPPLFLSWTDFLILQRGNKREIVETCLAPKDMARERARK